MKRRAMKLTRAKVPMCPQCKIALDWEWFDDAKDQGDGRCPKCRAPWFLHGLNHPDWGYHAPDVEAIREVVGELRSTTSTYVGMFERKFFYRLADRLEAALEGKNE